MYCRRRGRRWAILGTVADVNAPHIVRVEVVSEPEGAREQDGDPTLRQFLTDEVITSLA